MAEPVAESRPTRSSRINLRATLARLAVDLDYRGQDFGWELLRDALVRSVQLGESIGAAAVLVHCQDDQARRFYL